MPNRKVDLEDIRKKAKAKPSVKAPSKTPTVVYADAYKKDKKLHPTEQKTAGK